MTAIRTLIYNDWDKDSRKSPPQERPGREGPGESVPPPNLQILAWAQNRPLFPAALLTRFAEGTPEFDKINGLKKSFEVRFPAPAPATQNAGPARVGGMCDFSIGVLPWICLAPSTCHASLLLISQSRGWTGLSPSLTRLCFHTASLKLFCSQISQSQSVGFGKLLMSICRLTLVSL